MKTLELNIPLGYSLRSRTTDISLEDAYKLFTSRRAKSITRAKKIDGGKVRYLSHYFECPYCNKQFKAYQKYLYKQFGYCFALPDLKVEKKVVYDWLSNQITFKEKGDLVFSTPVFPSYEPFLICPSCKNKMFPSDLKRKVFITRCRHKISVKAQVVDTRELMSTPLLNKGNVILDFPLYEQLVFNFKNAHTYLETITSTGAKIAVFDFTADKNFGNKTSAIINAFKSKTVRRKVRQFFEEEWGREIPFCTEECTIYQLKALTQFIGYQRDFYTAIPYTFGSTKVDKTFSQAKAMHKAKSVVSIFQNSNLPQIKSVKKTFYEKPQLFFYLKECETLWSIIKDPNHFVSLLNGDGFYEIASDLHMRPAIYTFMKDYATLRGASRLMKMLNKNWLALCNYAVNYGSLSIEMRKKEQQKWLNKKKVNAVGERPPFAIPLCKIDSRIKPCCIDEFSFCWAQNSNDYVEASQQLQNCLKSWARDNYPVVLVRKEHNIVAALEMRDGFIFQAKTHNNKSIHRVPGLVAAFYKWYEKNRLKEDYDPPTRYPRINFEEIFANQNEDGLVF